MKKFLGLSALFFLVGFAQADQDRIVGIIGPSISSLPGFIAIAAPGGGKQNCLTDFSITVGSNTTLSILDAGTTMYAIDLSTVSTTSPAKSLPFNEDWYGTNSLCAGYNSALNITVLNQSGNASGYKLNYQGVIRGR